MKYLDYLDKELEKFPDTPELYSFKKEIALQMTEKANSLVSSGIKDPNVLNDLVISEFSDVSDRYAKSVNRKIRMKKAKRNAKIKTLLVLLYSLSLVCVYLLESFRSGNWGKTWLIMVGGIFLLTILLLIDASKSTYKKKGGIFVVRVTAVTSVILLSVFAFLVMTFAFAVHKAYLAIIAGVAFSIVCDAVISVALKRKTAIFSVMLYIPAVATLLYVLLGLGGVLTWHPGWIIIVFALLLDIVIAVIRTLKNSPLKDYEEV